MTRIKFCGLKTGKDVSHAVSLGARWAALELPPGHWWLPEGPVAFGSCRRPVALHDGRVVARCAALRGGAALAAGRRPQRAVPGIQQHSKRLTPASPFKRFAGDRVSYPDATLS